jgi:hypothetical protein
MITGLACQNSLELIDGEQLARLFADNASTDPGEPRTTP